MELRNILLFVILLVVSQISDYSYLKKFLKPFIFWFFLKYFKYSSHHLLLLLCLTTYTTKLLESITLLKSHFIYFSLCIRSLNYTFKILLNRCSIKKRKHSTSYSKTRFNSYFEKLYQLLTSTSIWLIISFTNSIVSIFVSKQLQIFGFNSQLYNNFSDALQRAQGIVALSLLLQVSIWLNIDRRAFRSFAKDRNTIEINDTYIYTYNLSGWRPLESRASNIHRAAG